MVEQVSPHSTSFCDLFAGTGVVGHEFKSTHKVIANDILYFSYVLNVANLKLSAVPSFSAFKSAHGTDPLSFLNAIQPELVENRLDDFVAQNYSPLGEPQRRYFTPENALKIDRIRQTIEFIHRNGLVNELEYFYLLAALLREVPSVSSTTGTYGAYLKSWDKRALKPFELKYFDIGAANKGNVVLNGDANEIISEICGDVLYLDTPYNSRQYSSNYHVLESIARYDYPELRGVTGLRTDRAGESGYCRKAQVYDLYLDLLNKANFKTIVISYSNEGILDEEQLVELVSQVTGQSPIAFEKIPYRRYKRTSGSNTPVNEFLIVGKKT